MFLPISSFGWMRRASTIVQPSVPDKYF